MARAPRTVVSRTSGQGVSRRAYQTAYALGQHGTGKFAASLDTPSRGRDYGKGKTGVDRIKPINVSYGNTIEPSDLVDVQQMFPKRK